MLQYIGLTAGEAFVVVYIAGFIITAQYWPKVGGWILTRLLTAKSSQTPDK